MSPIWKAIFGRVVKEGNKVRVDLSLKSVVGRHKIECEQAKKELWAVCKIGEMSKIRVQTPSQSRIFTNPWKAFKTKAFHPKPILTTPPHPLVRVVRIGLG